MQLHGGAARWALRSGIGSATDYRPPVQKRLSLREGETWEGLLRCKTMFFADLLDSSTALFLDFDGTLVDIADQPDEIEVPSSLVQTLMSLNQYLGGAIAVVSGRPIRQIDGFLGPLRVAAAGVHGTERRSASEVMTLLSTHPMDAVEQAARALAAQNAGLLVEGKRGSIALH